LPADLPLDHTSTFDRCASLAVNMNSNHGFNFAHPLLYLGGGIRPPVRCGCPVLSMKAVSG
jgi:hypothetical protein